MLVMVCAIILAGGVLLGVGRLVPTLAVLPQPSTLTSSAPASVRTPESTAAPPSAPPAIPEPAVQGAEAVAVDALHVAAGDPAPIFERGQEVGSVTIESAAYRSRIAGQDPAAGRRWLRVSLTYRATATLTYEAARWSALDANGKRHPWTGIASTAPSLGGGSLDPGHSRTGYVVISVPARVATVALVLQDADGHDVIVAALP